MLDLDVAGYATVTATASTSAAAGRRPLRAAARGLRAAVLARRLNEKFAAHNAAMWKNGLLVVVPKGVELEKPLYVRIAVTGQTFWRIVVVAEEGARASIIEEYASPSPTQWRTRTR